MSKEHKEKLSKFNKGKKLSPETRQKISEVQKGRGMHPERETAEKFYFSLPESMPLSEKRKLFRKRFSELLSKTTICRWLREWSDTKRSKQRPELPDAYKFYLSLPKSMELSEKRQQLYKKYPKVSKSTICYWVRKWQSVT